MNDPVIHRPLRTGLHRPGNIYWDATGTGEPGDEGQVGYIRIGAIAQQMVAAYNAVTTPQGPAVREILARYAHYRKPDGTLRATPGTAVEDIHTLLHVIADYEAAITWEVSCLGCSSNLDRSYADHVRTETAEAEVTRLTAELAAARKCLTCEHPFNDHVVDATDPPNAGAVRCPHCPCTITWTIS